MSSIPHSAPETPFKGTIGTMAVDNEKLVSTPPRTRLPDAPPNGILKQAPVPSELETEKDHGAEVQVPSTAPCNESPATSKSQEVHAQVEDLPEKAQEASDEELNQFDWEDLQFRYTKALEDINDRDDKLIEQVDRFSQALSFWAQAAAERDNSRAFKRLKTRERFVQLSEESLQQKKDHYIQVVDAFQKALALL